MAKKPLTTVKNARSPNAPKPTPKAELAAAKTAVEHMPPATNPTDDLDQDLDNGDTEGPSQKPAAGENFKRNFERSFTSTKKIISDVFKLKVASVIKQVGKEKDINVDPESFKPFEHTHIFRTFDSDGKRYDRSVPIANHFHLVDWEYNSKGEPVVKSVSGPMVMEKKLVRGKWTQQAVAANEYDEHTHEIEYIRSDEVEARRANILAATVVAIEANKGAPVPGVQEKP